MVEHSLERIKSYFSDISAHVENGRIAGAKYSHKEEKERDAFSDWPPILMVYADDHDKDLVKLIMASVGIRSPTWKYDAQTAQDWRPGGELYELQKSWERKNIPWYERMFRR